MPSYRLTLSYFCAPPPLLQIPVWLRWAQYLCSLKYGINLLVLNEFGESSREGWTQEQQDAAEKIITQNDIDPDKW